MPTGAGGYGFAGGLTSAFQRALEERQQQKQWAERMQFQQRMGGAEREARTIGEMAMMQMRSKQALESGKEMAGLERGFRQTEAQRRRGFETEQAGIRRKHEVEQSKLQRESSERIARQRATGAGRERLTKAEELEIMAREKWAEERSRVLGILSESTDYMTASPEERTIMEDDVVSRALNKFVFRKYLPPKRKPKKEPPPDKEVVTEAGLSLMREGFNRGSTTKNFEKFSRNSQLNSKQRKAYREIWLQWKKELTEQETPAQIRRQKQPGMFGRIETNAPVPPQFIGQ